MITTKPDLPVAVILSVLMLALPAGAQADAYLAATTGSGPNGYRSNQLDGNADLFDTPLSVNAFWFKSSSSALEDVTQTALGLDWKISKLATLGVKHNQIDNGSLGITGNALNLALTLNTLWNSDLLTRVDLKGAQSAYQFNDLPAAVRNDTINQTAASFTLNQDIVSSVTVYGGRDRYSYDRDPVNAALVLMRRAPRKYVTTSTNLVSFPDSTNRFGVSWRPLDSLTLDLSTSKTTTVVDQELKTKRLAIDYQATDHLNITAAVSKATATALVTKRAYPLVPAGTTIMAATDDTYTELSVGWTF